MVEFEKNVSWLFNPNYEIRNIAGYLFFKKAYRKIFQKEFDLFNRMLDIQSSFQNESIRRTTYFFY